MDIMTSTFFEKVAETLMSVVIDNTLEHLKASRFSLFANSYQGPFDFWKRGIEQKEICQGDDVIYYGLISPYMQLFPGNPYNNGKKWNRLYDSEEDKRMNDFVHREFYHYGSDHALRLADLNCEHTVVGLFQRYGYIGESVIGIVPTSILLKAIPQFFSPHFIGIPAKITGKVAKCPALHAIYAASVLKKESIDADLYKSLHYIQITKIQVAQNKKDKVCSLLGSPWAATSDENLPYIIQYGYLDNEEEREACHRKIAEKGREHPIDVYYDDLTANQHAVGFSDIYFSKFKK